MKRRASRSRASALDKNGKLVRSTKRMSVSKRIAQRKSKRARPKGGKRVT